MKRKQRRVGRPTGYEPAIVVALCLAIATSSEGLRRICTRNKRFPSTTTIYRWLAEHDEFRARYARFRRRPCSMKLSRSLITHRWQVRMAKPVITVVLKQATALQVAGKVAFWGSEL